jgi:nucleoside-diphosphate-sugar epimerase
MSIQNPILITGATGFIGRALAARLLAEGHALRAFVLPGESTEGAWPGPVEVVRGDIADAGSVQRALAGVPTVFHLAAVVGDWGDEALFQRITVDGTKNVLLAAAPGARVVLASSVVVYGDAVVRDVCPEDHPWGRPVGPYSRSKQQQEKLAFELARARGLLLTAVRPTNVYGPGSRVWVHEAIAVLRRGLPTLVGGGEKNAALCYVDNLCDVFVRAAATSAAVGRAYNASDGSDVTWKRYFTDLARIAGAKPPKSMPRPLARATACVCEPLWRAMRKKSRPPVTFESLNLVGSDLRVPIDRARGELGYQPKVSYEEGIARVARSLQ